MAGFSSKQILSALENCKLLLEARGEGGWEAERRKKKRESFGGREKASTSDKQATTVVHVYLYGFILPTDFTLR